MADVPQYTTVARPKDYWMSPRALSITLNARSEANRIAASASSGAQFFCHFEDIGDAQAEEMFGYDVGHNFRSWPLAISPTYFNTNNAIYPHIAIPRTDRGDSLAMVVFPTVVLDLWGYETETEPMQDEDGNYIDEYGNIVETAAEAATGYVRKKKSGTDTDADPVGSEEYYYIYLHGKLLAPFYRSGSLVRDWDPEIDTGRLNTDETWGEVITLEQLAREMKKKVDVEWFQRVFKIHGTGKKRVPTEWDDDGKPIEWETDDEGNIIYEGDDGERRDIKPNDMDHEITDTESMFGTWTQHWLSALGIGSGSGGSGGGGGGGDALEWPLLDINAAGMPTNPSAGDTIVYDPSVAGHFKWGQSGLSQQEADARYLKLQSQTEQQIVSRINMTGSFSYNGDFSLYAGSMSIGDGNPAMLSVRGDIQLAREWEIRDNSVLTKADADGMYVSVAFFESLFEVYNGSATDGNRIATNGTIPSPSTNVNIKSMFAFWTEQYLSALGQGSGGSGSGGVWYLSQLEDVDHNSTPSNGDALVWDGQQWTFDTAGLNENELGQYLSRNKYIKADSNTKWWGRTMSNGVVTGNIDMTLGDSICWNKGNSTYLSMVRMMAESGSMKFILGEGTTSNSITTSLIGTSIYFQTASGQVDASLTVPTGESVPVFYVKKLKIGSIVISEDTQNGGLHVENAGLYADTYVAALGAGSGGGGGTPLNSLLMSLNDTSLSPTSTGYTNAVLVNTNGTWSWKEYGGGTTNLKTLTVSDGTNTALTYNPGSDTAAKTLTVNGQKVDNTSVVTVTATTNTLTIALADNYGDTKNPYGSKTKGYVLAAPSGQAGTPAFRQLTAAFISDLSLTNGEITIGSNKVTPLTDAKLKADYTWWGQSMTVSNQQNVVTGTITVGNGDIVMNNNLNIKFFDTSDAQRAVLSLSSNNNLLVGYGSAAAGCNTYVYGKNVYLRYSTSGNVGLYLNESGLISIGSTSTSFITEKLNVNGNIRTASGDGAYVQIGGAKIIWDSTNQALHIDKGVYSDTFVSALGAGSGGGGGTPLNSLLMSLNDASGVQNPTSVSNKVLVNNRGTWSWETYGGGSGSGTIGGASDKADYFTGYVANSAAKLSPGKKINGTTFTGENDITTDKWGTARTITIKDNDETNSQSNTSIDGSADFTLKLPATIKASLTGTASKATRLASDDTKSAWGMTYWSGGKPQAISGNMTDVGNISFSASGKNIGGVAYFDTTNTRLGIGAAPGAYALDVSGDIHTSGDSYIDSGKALICKISSSSTKKLLEFDGTQVTLGYGFRSSNETRIYGKNIGMYYGTTLKVQVTTDGLKIGDITIKNENGGLHVIGGGLYTDTFLSSLGIGSGGGSGSGITMNDVWSALAVSAPNDSSEQIDLTHMTRALSTYAKTADVTKKLTIKQGDTVLGTYNGTAAQTITITGATTDTKDTAGTTGKNGVKLFLVGAASYGEEYAQTNCVSGCYIDTDNCLYSNSSKVLTTADSDSFCQIYRHELAAGKVLKITFGNRYHAMVYGRGQSSAGANIILTGVGYTTASNYWRCIMKGSLVSWRTQPSARGIEVSNGSSGILYISVVAIRGAVVFEEADALSGEAVTDEVAMTSDIVKNTAGVYTSSDAKLYLIGSKSTSSDENGYAKTFTNTGCYIGTDNCLYSNGEKVKTVKLSEKTAGNPGYELLTLGNDTKLSAAGNKYGALRLYMKRDTRTSGDPDKDVKYGQLVVPYTLTDNVTYTLPATSGTLALTSEVVTLSTDQNNISGNKNFTGTVKVNGNNVVHAANARNYCAGLQGVDDDGAYELPNNKNLNKVLAAGTYCCRNSSVASTITNSPISDDGFRLWHIVNTGTDNSSSSQWSAQILLAPNSGRLFIRSHNNNTFGSWKEFATTGDVVLTSGEQTIGGSKTFNNAATFSSDVSISGTLTAGTISNVSSLTIKSGGTLALTGSMSTTYISGTQIYDSSSDMSIQGTNKSSKNLSLCSGGGNVGVGIAAQSGYKLYVNGETNINGGVDITKGKTIYFQHTASGVPEISIGTKSNDSNLYLKGVNLYFNSSIINSSDMRLKDVDELVDGDIESIARAPIFYYRWKKTPEFGQHLGSSAQYWQNVFSCAVVKDEEGYLGLDYSATALAAAVMTARKVMDHEEQIAAIMRRLSDVEAENRAIKEENLLLRQEVELLKAA